MSDVIDNMQANVDKMRAHNQFQRDHLEDITRLVAASNAPEWISAPLLAEVAGVAGENPDEATVTEAAERTVEFFSEHPFSCPPGERNSALGWEKAVLLDAIRRVISHARADEEPGVLDAQRRVLDAVADLGDEEWVVVSQLGRDAGLVPTLDEDADDELKKDARLAAGQFGKSLRRAPWSLPETAFNSRSNANRVNVGALRQAAQQQVGKVAL